MIAQPTTDRPPLPSEMRDAVDRLADAQSAGDGLGRLDALADIDELWAALRPRVALRQSSGQAAVVDAAVAELHFATDNHARLAACNALRMLLP